MKNLICILAVLALSSFQAGEEAFDLLEKSLKKYTETSNFSFNYKVSWDCEGDNGKANLQGSYMKKGDAFLLRQGQDRTLMASGYLLNINDRDKIIIIQYGDSLPNFPGLYDAFKYDRQFVNGELIPGDKGKVLKFSSKKESPLAYVSSSEISLREDGWIARTKINYDKTQQEGYGQKCSWMQVDYAAYQIGVVDDKPLQVNTYVTIKGKEVTPAPAYKNYQVVSSLNYETE